MRRLTRLTRYGIPPVTPLLAAVDELAAAVAHESSPELCAAFSAGLALLLLAEANADGDIDAVLELGPLAVEALQYLVRVSS